MHSQNASGNTPEQSATRNAEFENVSHKTSFHQSSAMYAAQMVRFQYTKESKNQFKRECLEHLKASLAPRGTITKKASQS